MNCTCVCSDVEVIVSFFFLLNILSLPPPPPPPPPHTHTHAHTQWMPLPLFVVYRVLVLLYMLSWLIASGVDRGDKQGEGGKWLIFITNHTLLLINIGFLAITALTVGYAVVYYIDKSKLQRFYPKPAPTAQAFYSQDNIAWYVKICWVLYIVGVSSEIANICGFWVAIYEPCPPDDAMAEMTNSSLNSTSNDVRPCSNLDAISIHVHLILGLLALIDIYLSRVPYQILHFFYSISYMAFFVVFSGIYFAAEGTDHLGNPYIYSVLDYRESPAEAVGFCIVIVILPMIMYIILFLLAWLRDVIYSRIRFCFWDLRRSSTYCVGSSEKENGQWGPTTKVEVTTKV